MPLSINRALLSMCFGLSLAALANASQAEAQSSGVTHIPAGPSMPAAIKACVAKSGDVPVSYTAPRALSVKATAGTSARDQSVFVSELVAMHKFGILGVNKGTFVCFYDTQMNFLTSCLGYLKSPSHGQLSVIGCRLPNFAGEKTPVQQRRDARKAAQPAP